MRSIVVTCIYFLIKVLPAFSQTSDIPSLFNPVTSRLVQSIEFSDAESFVSAISIDSKIMEQIVDDDINTFLIPGTDMLPDTVIITRIMKHNVGYSIIGRINNSPYDSFTLSYADGKYLSRINQPSKHQTRHLRYVNDLDTHALLDIDRNSLDILTCGIEEHEHFKNPDSTNPPKEKGFRSPDLIQETSEIDVMIVYTPAAAQWALTNGGGIQNVMNQAMALAQLSFDNSEVDINVNLVHTYQANYTETGDSSDDLGNITDGSIPNVHNLRNQYGADLVAFFTLANDYGGIAWYLDNSDGSTDYGFSITRVQQASWTTTHAHEMAHNMGSDHSRNQTRSAAADGLLFEYSTGWRWSGDDGKVYLSVMTYNNPEDEDPGTDVEYFSNPTINYQGVPTGSYTGPYAPADNARSLNEIRGVISNYRPSSGIVIEEPVILLCEALDNCEMEFTTGGVTNWFGQSEVYNSGESAARSGIITHDQSSWVETTIIGPGELTFGWKVSSEETYDFLNLFVNSSKISGISGEVDWTRVSQTLAAGENIVRWSYDKDESINNGSDRGWLDEVVFVSNTVPVILLCEALDNCEMEFTTGGVTNWFGQSEVYNSGESAARSGIITHDQSSWVETTIIGPGELTFGWKVSSEETYDFLNLFVNSSKISGISGEVDWTRVSQTLAAGENIVRWSYDKDESINNGSDRGWLDEVVFVSNTVPQITVNLLDRWNLVGLPVQISHESYTELFPNAINKTLFEYTNGYQSRQTLQPGKGYWVRMGQSGSTMLTGASITSMDLELLQGWNLISGPTATVTESSIDDPNEILIAGSIFGFNGSYVTTTSMEPGKGYWIRTDGAGTITLSGESSSKSNVTHPSSVLSNFDRIEFLSGEDSEPAFTLYLSGIISSPFSTVNFELPPFPPSGNQDVRWEQGSYVIESKIGAALIQQGSSPIQVRVPQRSTEIVELSGTSEVALMREFTEDRMLTSTWIHQNELYNLSRQTSRVEFELLSKNELPVEFVLDQNYPNPFNPTTTIRFGIPESADVSLEVYTVLGQKIMTLVNENRSAGWHTVNFNGTGLSSGVYLYRIQAGGMVQTRKLMLVK